MSVTRRISSAAAFPFLLSALAAVACYVSAGASLGLFLGGVLMLTLIVPPIVMAEELSANRLIALSATLVPVAVVWLIGGVQAEVRVGEWLACGVILAAYAAALAGLAVGFRMIRCAPAVAAGLSVVAGLCWLTWPIWMSQTWHGEASAPGVTRLLAFHPVMTINVQLKFSMWSEKPIAYHLTDLGQNVSYAPTHSIWPTVLLHGLIGGGLLGLAGWRERRRRRELADETGTSEVSPLSAAGS